MTSQRHFHFLKIKDRLKLCNFTTTIYICCITGFVGFDCLSFLEITLSLIRKLFNSIWLFILHCFSETSCEKEEISKSEPFSDVSELATVCHLEGLHLTFNVEAGALLPLAIRYLLILFPSAVLIRDFDWHAERLEIDLQQRSKLTFSNLLH